MRVSASEPLFPLLEAFFELRPVGVVGRPRVLVDSAEIVASMLLKYLSPMRSSVRSFSRWPGNSWKWSNPA
ncbi:hypothetical protein BRC61_03280 [Halobacteriales archaeon QH_10_65_19]|nr:MAG: hypothetical protein BRC61_03280 [Halobacteriales archaeon QH_10_65_19]